MKFTIKLRRVAETCGLVFFIFLSIYGMIMLIQTAPAIVSGQPQTVSGQNGAQAVSTNIPLFMNYQGEVKDAAGQPLNGQYTMTFRIYSNPVGTSPLFTETHTNVLLRAGWFTVLLGDTSALSSSLFSSPDRYIGIAIEQDTEMIPRQRFASVPYALIAAESEHASLAISATSSTYAVEAGHSSSSDSAHNADQLDGLHSYDLVPPGTVIAYAGPTIPNGWMLCDGRTLKRAEYSALFTAISMWFGEGDGSTTFQIPDCTANTIIGSGGAPRRTNRILGQFGGTEAHTITMDDLPVHDTTELNRWSTGFVGYQYPSYWRVSNPISIMPPFIVMNYIIKY